MISKPLTVLEALHGQPASQHARGRPVEGDDRRPAVAGRGGGVRLTATSVSVGRGVPRTLIVPPPVVNWIRSGEAAVPVFAIFACVMAKRRVPGVLLSARSVTR